MINSNDINKDNNTQQNSHENVHKSVEIIVQQLAKQSKSMLKKIAVSFMKASFEPASEAASSLQKHTTEAAMDNMLNKDTKQSKTHRALNTSLAIGFGMMQDKFSKTLTNEAAKLMRINIGATCIIASAAIIASICYKYCASATKDKTVANKDKAQIQDSISEPNASKTLNDSKIQH